MRGQRGANASSRSGCSASAFGRHGVGRQRGTACSLGQTELASEPRHRPVVGLTEATSEWTASSR